MKKWYKPDLLSLNIYNTAGQDKPPGCVSQSGPTGGLQYICPNQGGIASRSCKYFIPDGIDQNAHQARGFCSYRPTGSQS
ncbi:hypothetical protein [Terrisporobacter vanillatitrophus]|uniref:hypothetical protein n=1 Tax=Terrisporobacter vanillatitrophus TaxID=3058402 RepID=UPI003366902E